MIDPYVFLTKTEQEDAIERFIQLIQFPTVSSIAIENNSYYNCGQWLIKQCKSINIFDDVYILPESPIHSPVIIAKIIGQQPTLPVLLFNSHYDVVPVINELWTICPNPFIGYRYNNNIYGRGTQDMKCVCIQYIEALRKIYTVNPYWKPVRTIYITFIPDEEVGGSGMACLLDSTLYKNDIVQHCNGIAIAFDEGLASTTNNFSLFYGERLPWWISVTASGPTGHGSRFINNTAIEQLLLFMNKASEFRTGQRTLLYGNSSNQQHENCSHVIAAKNSAKIIAATTKNAKNNTVVTNTNNESNESVESNETDSTAETTLGDVTSLNITMLEAGVKVGTTYAYNCIPPIAKCTMDIRISPHTVPSTISTMLDTWCIECSRPSLQPNEDQQQQQQQSSPKPTIEWSYIGDETKNNTQQQHAITSINPIDNQWYKLFVKTIEQHCCDNNTSTSTTTKVIPQIFPAATDSRFLRLLGIRAFGFSPIRNTEIMLHENDEYIPEYTFLEGICIYYHIILSFGTFMEES